MPDKNPRRRITSRLSPLPVPSKGDPDPSVQDGDPSTDTPKSLQLGGIQMSDLPSAAVMEAIGVDHKDFGDFIKALDFTKNQMQGIGVTESALAAGIAESSIYEDRWKQLIASARSLLIGKHMMEVEGQVGLVLQEWPAVIDRLLKTAKSARRDSDATDATELLYSIFIQNAPTSRDASKESAYLKQKPNFNPMSPINQINVEAGATVIVNDLRGSETKSADNAPADAVEGEVTEIT